MFIRRLTEFDYHTPDTVSEALDLMGRYNGTARLIAGGTDLLLAMKKREVVPAHLVSLAGVEALKGITFDEKNGLRIGSLTTLAEIESSTIIKEKYAPLWDAVRVMASAQVRNLATIGGNLCSAVPSADTAPPLIALAASVQVTGRAGERTIKLEEFFTGPKACNCGKDEIVAAIVVPKQAALSDGAYLKLMRRHALDLALVSVAACVTLDAKKVCTAARVALGAVAPTPMRVSEVEAALIGKTIDEAVLENAARIAGTQCRPITDIRASMEYRCSMVEVLTRRAVTQAVARIKG